MSDVNERAVELSRRNAQRNGVPARVMQSDGYADVPFQRMDWIVQNPPIRGGQKRDLRHVRRGSPPSGTKWRAVAGDPQAAGCGVRPVRYLKTLFGRVEAATKKGGFWVLRCTQPRNGPTRNSIH